MDVFATLKHIFDGAMQYSSRLFAYVNFKRH